MGISRGGARLLLDEARVRPFHGRLLQLGRQTLWLKPHDLDELAALHGVTLRSDIPPENIRPAGLGPPYLDDGTFFSRLGFDSVESVDFSDFEGADHTYDLNLPVPSELRDRFDVIYDGGTIEHIFDIRAVLKNIFEMLVVGGRVIHATPSSNHVDHGFYMFSPTFFLDYYLTNGFTVYDILLAEYDREHNTVPWSIHEYEPGCLDGHFAFGGFDRGKLLLIHAVAEKRADSTWHKIPQQRTYTNLWKEGAAASKEAVIARPARPRMHEPPRSLLDRLLRRPAPMVVPNKIAEY